MAALALGNLLASPAAAFEMRRQDRLAALYSNQVVFDRQGEPLVSVRVTESQAAVDVTSAGRLTLMPGGDDGARVSAKAGARWTVTVEEGRPAEVRWWVIVDQIGARDLAGAARAREQWRRRGHPEVELIEAGAVIGLGGTTLDTRRRHVGIDPQADRDAAEARAAELAGELGVSTAVLGELVRRPGGWIVARDARSGFEIRAKDLLWITPEAPEKGPPPTVDLPDMEWGHGTPKRGRADRSYHGDVYLAVGRDGKLVAVNLLSAEALLEGVVPSEIFPSAPEAALQAQAVAARGQLLAKVGTRHRADPYLLCAETHCQVYKGQTRARPRTDAAVRATRGQLLFDARGLVDTTYSSACGGHSEAFHMMWGGPPKPSSPGRYDVADGSLDPLVPPGTPEPEAARIVAAFVERPGQSWCAASGGRSKVYRWTKTRTAAQVDAAVDAHAGRTVSPIHAIRPVRRGVSGRALAVEYVGGGGRYVVEGSYENRKLLGHLRSGMWVVERVGARPPGEAPAKWRFRGGGFGHGVGMCQHGAIGQARAGRGHDLILKHYYPGSRLETAW